MGDSTVKLSVFACDSKDGPYKAGELISAKVVLELTQPKKIRGLRVEIVGRSVVSWSVSVPNPDDEGESMNVITSSEEEYLSSTVYILGSETGRAIELPIGEKSYPVNIQLPLDLPSSFEDKKQWGVIRYTIKAIFERPWSFDYECEVAIPVVSNYDLNEKPQASFSIEEEIHKRFCCFCICPWGKVHMKVLVPSSGFVPGQMIPVIVQCENESTVNVSKIKVHLLQKMKFYATTPKRSGREYDVVVAENNFVNPFTTTFEDHVTVQLKVPQVPPSGLEYCSIIDLDYVLKVVICFSGMHCSIKRQFPVLIGTVPLHNSSNMVRPNIVPVPTPSAPLLPEIPSCNKPFVVPLRPSDMPQPGPFSNDVPANPQCPSYWESNNSYPPPYDAGGSSDPRYAVQGYGAINRIPNPPAYDEKR